MSSLRPLRIVTRCTSVHEFVAYFGPLSDEQSIFLVTAQPLEQGSRHPFSVVLGDGAPVLMGEGEVSESQPAAMRWKVLSLDETSRAVHARLLAVRDVGALPPPPEQMTVTLRLETALFQPAPPGMAPPWSASHAHDDPSPPILPAPLGRTPTVPPDAFGKTPPPEPLRAASQFSTNEERAWYDDVQAGADLEPTLPRPPTAPTAPGVPAPGVSAAVAVRAPVSSGDEPYADSDGGRPRGFWIAIGSTAAGALLVGILTGYLIWGGGGDPKAATTPAGSGTGGELAVAGSVRPPRVAARGAPPAADDPADPGAKGDSDGKGEQDQQDQQDQQGQQDQQDANDGDDAPVAAAVSLGGDCLANIRSEPGGAEVTVGGKPAGKTPLESVAVPCGTLVVTLNRPRYERVERRVEAVIGTPAIVDERLARPEAVLELSSTPAGAAMSVDGRSAGNAPASARVSAFGKVTVTATLAGYKPWRQQVYVKGRKQRVSAKLEAAKPSKADTKPTKPTPVKPPKQPRR